MMKVLLGLPEAPEEDASDALACAISHIHFAEVERRIARAANMIAWLKGSICGKRSLRWSYWMWAAWAMSSKHPMTTFYDLPGSGEETVLSTPTWWFAKMPSCSTGLVPPRNGTCFAACLKVSGVGPRVGLAILSGISADDFLACIVHEDIKQLTTVPGIGTKTAQRLVVEMKDRLEKEMDLSTYSATGLLPVVDLSGSPGSRPDAISALIALGYKPADASRSSVNDYTRVGMKSDSEELIRTALQNLVRRREMSDRPIRSGEPGQRGWRRDRPESAPGKTSR